MTTIPNIKAVEWTLGKDGRWSGIDSSSDRFSTSGAEGIIGLKFEDGALECIEAPASMTAVGTGQVRAIGWHKKADGTLVQLVVSGSKLYADGVEQKLSDASTLTISGTDSLPAMDQGPNKQTLIVTGNASDPAYLWDETLTAPNRVIAVQIPATPGGMTAVVSEISANMILSLEGTQGATIAAPWTVQGASPGHWDQTLYDSSGFGVPSLKLNTDVSIAVNDGVFYGYASDQDWTGYNTIIFDVHSRGENTTGTFLAFVFGKTASPPTAPDSNETVIPFAVRSAGTVNTVELDLSKIETAKKTGIRYFGIRVVDVTNQFTIWFHNLRTQSGTVGKRCYLRTRHKVTAGMELVSIESPMDADGKPTLEVDAGTKGSKIVLTLTDGAVPYGYVDKLWRKVKEIDSVFRYTASGGYPTWQPQATVAVGTYILPPSSNGHYYKATTAGVTGTTAPTFPTGGGSTVTDGTAVWTEQGSYSAPTTVTDDVADTSANPSLKRGRTAPHTGPTLGFFSRGRLGLYKQGVLQLSGVGSHAWFSSVTPATLPAFQALNAVDAFDPITLNIGEIGNCLAAARFGLTTAESFSSGVVLLTDTGISALLQGDSVSEINLHRQQPGGICGRLAWCRDEDGNIVAVSPDGAVYTMDRQLNTNLEKPHSQPIRDALRNATGKSAWALVADRIYNRITLFGPSAYVLHDGEWTTLDADTVGTVTAVGTQPSAGGGYAVIGGALGALKRLFDPDATRAEGTYTSGTWQRLPEQWRASSVQLAGTGTPTVDVLADSVEVSSAGITSRPVSIRRHRADGFQMRVTVPAGSKVRRVQAVLTQWRG